MKKIFTIFTITMLVMLNVTFVNASSFEFTAQAQKEVFKPGEEVYVYMNIDNIQAGDEGINVVEMDLEYDESVFESMEFLKKNDWNYDYNSDKSSEKFGKLLFTNISTGITQAESIGNIKFKLKSDLPDMETQIKLKQVTSNDGKELIPVGDRIISIKIVNDKAELVEPDVPEEPTVPETPDESEQPNNEVVEGPIEELVKTGQSRFFYIVIGIVIGVCIVALIIIAVLKKKNKDDE